MPINYPSASAETLGKFSRKFRLAVIGQCSVGPLVDKFASDVVADHYLIESRPYSLPPDIEYSIYDGIVIALTLRHILEHTPSFDGGSGGSEIQWARLIGRPGMADYFEHCAANIKERVLSYKAIAVSKPCIFLTFMEPRQNFVGVLSKKYTLDNPGHFVRELNRVLEECVSDLSLGYCIDINEAVNSVGRSGVQDDIFWHIGHASYQADEYITASEDNERLQLSVPPSAMYSASDRISEAQSYIAERIIDALRIINKIDSIKLIVVDLDDTMWRGVAADSDRPKWQLTEGWPKGLAEALLIFKARGGMLAICSKNDDEPTRERFAEMMGNSMKLSDFVSVQINFETKSSNIQRILGDVNVLPGNVLFIDDNPREVEEVIRVFPEIRVLSRQHYDWRRVVLMAPELQVERISSESLRRTESVQAAITRRNVDQTISREEWIKSLEIRQWHVIVDSVNHDNFARASELINKTNQFNTTGKRWQAHDFVEFFSAGGIIVCAFSRDRLVENGLIGATMILGREIIQVVLSCRVFGFDVEKAMLRFSMESIRAGERPVKAIVMNTGKNHTCHDFFIKNNFLEIEAGTFESTQFPDYPAWISLDS
ncbi:HAD-IIIC family phosphatase [Paraburkholderia ferrariae]|uniref:HAD-IIIC family phosphatase n=1 Tax=Paraburkholderia ferrariae TaxID=386056 RepID=UPI0009FCA2E7|nr:HAD-IIIC family phosphatase [Paraburkholderia ferrariae]